MSLFRIDGRHGKRPFSGDTLHPMSLSTEERKREMAVALKLMFDAVGDEHLFRLHFYADEERFTRVHPTTWKDMEDRGWIKQHQLAGGGLRLHLSCDGWLDALRGSGVIQTTEFETRLGRLNSYLKRRVDGRQCEDLVAVETVAAETGLPGGWIYNMAACRYWQIARRQHGAEIDPKTRPPSIWIDHRFGLAMI